MFTSPPIPLRPARWPCAVQRSPSSSTSRPSRPISRASPSISATIMSGWPTISHPNLFPLNHKWSAGCYALLSSLHVFTHKFQHYPVNPCVFKPALFQIFASAKLAKGVACDVIIDAANLASIVSAVAQQFLQFKRQYPIYHQNSRWIRGEEIEFM